MGVCPQHDVLWPSLTVREHLELYATLKGVPAAEVGADPNPNPYPNPNSNPYPNPNPNPNTNPNPNPNPNPQEHPNTGRPTLLSNLHVDRSLLG